MRSLALAAVAESTPPPARSYKDVEIHLLPDEHRELLKICNQFGIRPGAAARKILVKALMEPQPDPI
jgi:hypothetical protein